MSIYVAKVYTVGLYGFTRLDDERAFGTKEEALAYLREDFFEEEGDQDIEEWAKDYFAEIVEYSPKEGGGLEVIKTRYTLMGEVFFTLRDGVRDESQRVSTPAEDFTPKFQQGDIVRIRYNPNGSRALFAEVLGVVNGVPTDTPASEGEEVDTCYLVDYIGEAGFLTHCHPEEAELELYAEALPEELRLLRFLSEDLRGRRSMPEELSQALYQGEIYALNIKGVREYSWFSEGSET